MGTLSRLHRLQDSVISPALKQLSDVSSITLHSPPIMGSSPLPVSLQSKFQRSQSTSRLRDYHGNFNILRNIIFALFVLRILRKSFYFLRGHGLIGSILVLYRSIHKNAYKMFLNLPGVRSQVSKQLEIAKKDMEDKLVPSGPGTNHYRHLPKEPWTKEQLHTELESLAAMKRTRWEEGKVSGAVYHGESSLLDIQSEAMRLFSVANPIHADVFPAVRKMEAEVVAMVLALFNAPESGAGATTSGGTESILMACLSARQKGYSERRITEPEMIIPSTAHAAFHKAANYFKIKPNTVLLVGSAPNYPHGIVDNIPALSKLALAYKIPLHVDCCLGSFIMPCLAKAGFPSPWAEKGGFDFRQPGVTSISVDTHKYGFAPKGNSCILYRNRQLREYQYFICPEWSGGVYGSPSIAGSRPGALIAGCWASLMRMGEDGYLDTCLKIVGARQKMEDAIRESEKLKYSVQVIGKPMVSVVAFRAVETQKHELKVDIYDVADGMSARGWHLNALQDPAAIHVAVTIPIVAVIDDLIKDLEEVVLSCQGKAVEKKGDTAALYGVAGALPDKSVVRELA